MNGTSSVDWYYNNHVGGFSTDLSRLFGLPVCVWAYGHTHWYNDIDINGTRVVSNPHGYPTEGIVYRDDFVIKI